MTWHAVGGSSDPAATVVGAVHGMADHWTTWRTLAGELGRDHRWYAFAAPWRGSGAVPTSPGDCVGKALRQAPEPIEILAGHSFGANAVLDHLATGAAPDVRAALLIAPLIRPPGNPPRPVLIARTRAALRTVVADGLRARLGARGEAMDADVFAGMTAAVLDGMPGDAVEAVLDRILDTPRPALAGVTVPALVLSGRSDQRMAGARPGSLAVLPHAQVRIRDRYDHFCHLTQAADVAADWVAFRNRLTRGVAA
ncbi:alpha/beta fold hydrolase [Actinoplanes sp. NEAU-A12]|uniref:Alpha/beta fold hydrolase n=1 Tax=Actinoplanes sandaracinus TaxID=3045177 RepID=A0ABT6WHS9_9ACTN|nr:alpha/beta fold hydrolase [Actinoplanes sandaracinus]MDI6099262.1 alpha/beta fold hydrolase [Actinoplanes sandaracinus]